jgi:serine/threonine-protein kinase HipA
MMRKGIVYVHGRDAGTLEETEKGFRFLYLESYLADSKAPAISLTLPRKSEAFQSPHLFPFFFGLLAEGNLKAEQCMRLKLDEDDAFGRLLMTAGSDTIGAVTVKPDEG